MSAVQEQQTLAAIQAAYDAVGQPQRWQSFLDACTSALGAQGAMLLHQTTTGVHWSIDEHVGIEAHWMDALRSHYWSVNPYVPHAHRLPEGRMVSVDTLVPSEVALKSEFYADWVRPQGYQLTSLVLRFSASSFWMSGLSIHFERSRPPEALEASPHHAAIVPHIVRAMALHRQMCQLRQHAVELEAALERTRTPIILCDRLGAVTTMTRVAQQILDARDGLWREGNRLVAVEGAAQAALARALMQTANTAEGKQAKAAFPVRIPRPSGKRDYQLVVAPMPRRDALFGLGSRSLVFLHDPEHGIVPAHVQLLTELYSLTPRETDVLRLLLVGRTTVEIADQLRLGRETIKFHMKSLFEKTGTRGQVQLVSHVLRGLGRLEL